MRLIELTLSWLYRRISWSRCHGCGAGSVQSTPFSSPRTASARFISASPADTSLDVISSPRHASSGLIDLLSNEMVFDLDGLS